MARLAPRLAPRRGRRRRRRPLPPPSVPRALTRGAGDRRPGDRCERAAPALVLPPSPSRRCRAQPAGMWRAMSRRRQPVEPPTERWLAGRVSPNASCCVTFSPLAASVAQRLYVPENFTAVTGPWCPAVKNAGTQRLFICTHFCNLFFLPAGLTLPLYGCTTMQQCRVG